MKRHNGQITKGAAPLVRQASTRGIPVIAGPWSQGLAPDTLEYLTKSLNKQREGYRKRLKQCQKRFSERAVHELRIQTRRLLSMVELLGPFLDPNQLDKAQRALKERLDAFADLRDTQVQLRVVKKLGGDFAAARPFERYLRKREKRFAKKTRKRIYAMKAGRLVKLISQCREQALRRGGRAAPDRASARLLHCVERAFVRARELRERIDARDTATIHQARISFKRFRYMVEILAEHDSVYDRRMPAAMHRYQTLMGNIQDSEVLLRAWDSFLDRKGLEAAVALAFRQALLRRRRERIGAYLHQADRLLEFWPNQPRSSKSEGNPQAEIRGGGTARARRRRARLPSAGLLASPAALRTSDFGL